MNAGKSKVMVLGEVGTICNSIWKAHFKQVQSFKYLGYVVNENQTDNIERNLCKVVNKGSSACKRFEFGVCKIVVHENVLVSTFVHGRERLVWKEKI